MKRKRKDRKNMSDKEKFSSAAIGSVDQIWQRRFDASGASVAAMPKTIAQQLKIKEFPFGIKNNAGKWIYYENETGYWARHEYNELGQRVYSEDSSGFSWSREYDADGKQTKCVAGSVVELLK